MTYCLTLVSRLTLSLLVCVSVVGCSGQDSSTGTSTTTPGYLDLPSTRGQGAITGAGVNSRNPAEPGDRPGQTVGDTSTAQFIDTTTGTEDSGSTVGPAHDLPPWDDDSSSNCSATQVVNCYGGCTSASWLSDGMCDPSLNCAALNWDDGDCSDGESDASLGGVEDTPEPAADASWGPEDAPGPEDIDEGCDWGEIIDCYGGCLDLDAWGDGYCNWQLDCSALSSDGGDCSASTDDTTDSEPLEDVSAQNDVGPGADSQDPDCESWQVVNCYGGCTSESWLNDSICDNALNCAAWDWDDGDCVD